MYLSKCQIAERAHAYLLGYLSLRRSFQQPWKRYRVTSMALFGENNAIRRPGHDKAASLANIGHDAGPEARNTCAGGSANAGIDNADRTAIEKFHGQLLRCDIAGRVEAVTVLLAFIYRQPLGPQIVEAAAEVGQIFVVLHNLALRPVDLGEFH